ncbi:MAG TPA: DUF2318 domain-containing protein [Blastocatellia bacterium]|nr:DUF2318 domain-containing protein [Blastocatellia bacterium]
MGNQAETREKKRAQFSETGKSKSKLSPVLIIVFLALAGVAAYAVFNSLSDQPAATTVTNTSNTEGAAADIRIPIADLQSGKAKFFDYTLADNKRIRFFAIKSSDGVYRAAMDACDTCFHAKQGYRQEGDEMVCNNCGLKFHSTLINEVSGGCNPVGLPRSVEGDHLVIKASELASRSRYF